MQSCSGARWRMHVDTGGSVDGMVCCTQLRECRELREQSAVGVTGLLAGVNDACGRRLSCEAIDLELCLRVTEHAVPDANHEA